VSEEPTPPLAPAPEPEPLPVARVRRRWPRLIHLAWLIPLVAAIVAGALIWERTHEYGPTIKIRFDDGTGLKPGQSEIRHLGVTVADVSAVQLSPDRDHVVVSARVRREAAAIAREGAVFWIDRKSTRLNSSHR